MSHVRLISKEGYSLPMLVRAVEKGVEPSDAPGEILKPGDELGVTIPEGGSLLITVAGDADPEATLPPAKPKGAAKSKAKK